MKELKVNYKKYTRKIQNSFLICFSLYILLLSASVSSCFY
jgi:hypothetical protein